MKPEKYPQSTDLDSGYAVEITQDEAGLFHVDMWKPNGENHWHRVFTDEKKAVEEYHRWT